MKQKIRPKIFEKAAQRLYIPHITQPKRLLPRGCCSALRRSDANAKEKRLFAKMHETFSGSAFWFGATNIPANQILRKQILLETALNLRAQGFAK